MSAQTLPSSALWEVARNLSLKELRRVKAESAGTRLEWLLTTLRSMETYSDEALHSAFAAAFPGINKGSLRTYKKQLWIVLERTLPSYDAEGIGTEVQLWHRLWLSILLWQRGNAHAARILWQQAIEKSTKTGWYEPASWSFSLTPPLLKERNMDKERIMDFDYFRKSRMHTLFSPCRKYGMALGLGLLYAQAPEADLKVICLERKADGSYQEIGRSSCSPDRKDPCFSFIETCTQRGYVAVVSSSGVLPGEEERVLFRSLSLYLGGEGSPPLRMEVRRSHR
ncbi:MAG: hypothetical protein N2170_09470, partial [Bacteroidia bacterium]|nr:hypothetical protein [Bacteroidia bacterium]